MREIKIKIIPKLPLLNSQGGRKNLSLTASSVGNIVGTQAFNIVSLHISKTVYKRTNVRRPNDQKDTDLKTGGEH